MGTAEEDGVTVELMVDFRCAACIPPVKSALSAIPGVTSVDVELELQRVVVQGTASTASLLAAAETTGRTARLVGHGQGDSSGFAAVAKRFGCSLAVLQESLAAVAEFKGASSGHGELMGVVRLVQGTPERCQVEAYLDGLTPGAHTLAVHSLGDLRDGIRTAGSIYTAEVGDDGASPAGHLGTLVADEAGHAELRTRCSDRLKVWDIIGRTVAVHDVPGAKGGDEGAAAVVARSSSVGLNYKTVCSCDGTVLWETRPPELVNAKTGGSA
mmetsp:Transcript_13137/g.25087  ORF Transcript_13137/g.25087 Transcript_13137/m.25087 type:complete len:270 (+) Transcript_13137:164-973(+)|eukprot:CAMPEP_0114236620 /NCGR_PEP_ID=MMETSP0058-20121206/6938_1 /TAXON_ID=36894 /ORGANISM="Pyramimonas parkeae, CCMP726" /LENGTH=269 /DNA_ID=CAMNT_0001348575 /DNA_START=153 /DNA_END=962 /DNA_ORIENTATION=+